MNTREFNEETLKRHVIAIIIQKNGEARFSEIFLNTYHTMDIEGFRGFLKKLIEDGIIRESTEYYNKTGVFSVLEYTAA